MTIKGKVDTEVNRLLFEGLTKENEKAEIVAGLA